MRNKWLAVALAPGPDRMRMVKKYQFEVIEDEICANDFITRDEDRVKWKRKKSEAVPGLQSGHYEARMMIIIIMKFKKIRKRCMFSTRKI